MVDLSRKALFLDRDGVINVNHGYVYQQAKFDFIPHIFKLVRQAKQQNYLVIVVTNQSGIGRAYYTEEEFHLLNAWMRKQFSDNHGCIDAIFYCPHHPSKAKPPYLKNCDCRKPEIGMINQAQSAFNIDLSKSIMIGDKISDIAMANKAKIQHAYWLTEESQAAQLETSNLHNYSIISSLDEAKLLF